MFWRLFCVTLLLALLGSTTGQESAVDGCAKFLTCDQCTNASLCNWMSCQDSPDQKPVCRNSTFVNETVNCSIVNCTVSTVAPPVTSPANVTNSTIQPNTTTTVATTKSPTVAPTKNGTIPSNTTASPTSPPPKKSTFDAASFIGGIVLVLGLQAVIFFLYKFCKSKDRNYHTL
ncbi:sialomucin core protein 24 [Paramisgurnus dabryanus]|uniref:sialomucin core protein 24 n=1 Tax=Paramisgurnus dabryanus TaxID=90735 RepID=UPI0031F3A777